MSRLFTIVSGEFSFLILISIEEILKLVWTQLSVIFLRNILDYVKIWWNLGISLSIAISFLVSELNATLVREAILALFPSLEKRLTLQHWEILIPRIQMLRKLAWANLGNVKHSMQGLILFLNFFFIFSWCELDVRFEMVELGITFLLREW